MVKSTIHALKKVQTIVLFLGMSSVTVITSSILFSFNQSPKMIYGVGSIAALFLILAVLGIVLFIHHSYMLEVSLVKKNRSTLQSLDAAIKELQTQQTQNLQECSNSSSVTLLRRITSQINELEKSFDDLSASSVGNMIDTKSAVQQSRVLLEELTRTNANKHSALRSHVVKLEEQSRSSIDDLKSMIQDSDFRTALMVNEMYRSLNLPETVNVPKEIRGEVK
ncbi:hypothetical protein ACTXJX_16430 [Glutamicibacter ardleyensis]|uniref:hypothetical protein n=1 Tax=Glutamicibacter ardleyensis TaxID=225894 RepID=UPI003FD3BB60